MIKKVDHESLGVAWLSVLPTKKAGKGLRHFLALALAFLAHSKAKGSLAPELGQCLRLCEKLRRAAKTGSAAR